MYWKLISFIILTALTVFSCTNHEKLEAKSNSTDYWGLHFNGNVKLVEYKKINTENGLLDSSKYEFDPEGYLIGESFSREGTYVQRILRRNENIDRVHLYDLAEYFEYENGKLVEKNVWKDSLDSKGNIVQQKAFDLSNRLIRRILYSYSDSAELILKQYINIESNTVDVTEFYYDSTEVLIKEVFNKYIDSIPNRGFVKMYNLDGTLSAEIEYIRQKEWAKTIYGYDSLMNLNLIRTYYSDSVILHEIEINYNEKGVKTDSIVRNYDNSIISGERLYDEELFRFDDRGEVIELIIKQPSSALRTSSYSYVYDSQSHLVEKRITHSNGHTIIKYDKNGSSISKELFDKNGKQQKMESFVITYDQMGNVVQNKRFVNDTLKDIINCRIEYYNRR